MKTPASELTSIVSTLRPEGDKAVSLLIETALAFIDNGTPDLASDWIGIAVQTLPRTNRNLLIRLFELRALWGRRQSRIGNPQNNVAIALSFVLYRALRV